MKITLSVEITRDRDEQPPVDLNPALVERAPEPWPDDGEVRVGFRGSRSSGGLRRRDATTGRFIVPRKSS